MDSVRNSVIVEQIKTRGAALIKGGVDPQLTCSLRDEVKQWYETNSGEYEIVNGVSGAHLRELVDPLLNAMDIFFSVAQDYLATDRVVVPVNHLLFRKRDDRTDALLEQRGARHNFHQDHGLIPRSFPLNAWVALSEVDGDRQGLSFLLPSPSEPTDLAIHPEKYVAQTEGGEIWSPHMNPGDILIFHQLTIHGCFTMRGKPKARYSAEFRAGSLANSPDEYRNTLWMSQPRRK